MRRSELAIGVAAALALYGCGGSGSTKNDGGDVQNGAFFQAARNAAPAIAPASSSGTALSVARSAARAAGPWAFGNPAYEIFNALRDYDPVADEGTIGLDNVYKSLHQAGQFYDEYRTRCGSIAAKVVASPFDFGNAVVYDCALNDATQKHGHASREDGGVQYGLSSWQVDRTGSTEMGVMEGSYDPTSGAVSIDEAVYVDYTAQEDFSIRYLIEGNATTHAFTLKLMKYTAGTGYQLSLVGAGISRGAGNSFLFKASDNGYLPTPSYYCFAADTTETSMMGATANMAVPEACAGYQATVDALAMYTSADVPTAAASFAGSSIYLDF